MTRLDTRLKTTHKTRTQTKNKTENRPDLTKDDHNSSEGEILLLSKFDHETKLDSDEDGLDFG